MIYNIDENTFCASGSASHAFKKLYDVIVRLRSAGGCRWDIEQTPQTLRGCLIEETYECVEAIDQNEPAHIKEELGDIFLVAAMIAYMYEQEGLFSVADVLNENTQKLIRRHPHVFKSEKDGQEAQSEEGLTSNEILENWAKIKVEKEGRAPKNSLLDDVRRGLPPLDKACKLQKKAAKVGFDWQDAAGVIAKVKEELQEVEDAAAALAATGNAANSDNADAGNAVARAALEGELGDLLFSAVNLCRFFKVEPSVALQRTNVKFSERFKYVEQRMKESCKEMSAANLAIMDEFWNMAK